MPGFRWAILGPLVCPIVPWLSWLQTVAELSVVPVPSHEGNTNLLQMILPTCMGYGNRMVSDQRLELTVNYLNLCCYQTTYNGLVLKEHDKVYTPASNLGYLAPPPRTIFHGCQIVHWDPLDAKQRCPKKKFGLGYVLLHGFYGNPQLIWEGGSA